MICNKCNHNIPDDSEFCQYCGNKLEKSEATENSNAVESASLADDCSDISDMSLDDILKIQAKATIDAMNANSEAQPDFECDEDFGLVPEKPIFTLALKSVDGEEEYLNKLRTTNGERIRYSRRGSTMVGGINGTIDIYDTYLPSGEFYKTIYINMYGANDSTSAPKGFVFAVKTTRTTSVNTHKPVVDDLNKPKKLINKKRLITVISIVVAVVLLISLVGIVISCIENYVPKKITASFDSVEDLKAALKNDPNKYEGKRVSVKGYAKVFYSIVYLFDDLPAADEPWGDRTRYEVHITDDAKLAVLENGDYIDLNGVITISPSGEIYMLHCDYSFANTKAEQTNNTNTGENNNTNTGQNGSTPKETLTVAIVTFYYPYEYESNGEYKGVNVDLAKEFARRNNMNVVFVVTSASRMLDGVRNGTFDMALGMYKTPENEAGVTFTDLYHLSDLGEEYAVFHGTGVEALYRARKFNDMIYDGTVDQILSSYGLQ